MFVLIVAVVFAASSTTTLAQKQTRATIQKIVAVPDIFDDLPIVWIRLEASLLPDTVYTIEASSDLENWKSIYDIQTDEPTGRFKRSMGITPDLYWMQQDGFLADLDWIEETLAGGKLFFRIREKAPQPEI